MKIRAMLIIILTMASVGLGDLFGRGRLGQDGGGGFGLSIAASNSSPKDKGKADYACDGTADDVQIQAAINEVSSTGGTVFLSAGTYNINSSIIMKSGVLLRGEPVSIAIRGMADLLGQVGTQGTIITGTASPAAIIGNNTSGGGIEDIAFSGINGISMGKTNQFGPQFFRISNVHCFEPVSVGIELINMGHVAIDNPAVFCTVAPAGSWTGIRIASDDGGNADAPTFTVNDGTDICTISSAETNLGLVNGDIVYLYNTGGAFPTVSGTAISILTPYYLININTNTFQLSRTLGGAAIDFTGTGTGTQKVLGCLADWQPGHVTIINSNITYNVTESTARVVNGIHLQTVKPVYGGVTHEALQLNYITTTKTTVLLFGFSGTKEGSNRNCIFLDGASSAGVVFGCELSGIDIEGAAQNGVRCKYMYGSSLNFVGVSGSDAFDAGLYMETCVYNSVVGTGNLTYEAKDATSAITCVASGAFHSAVQASDTFYRMPAGSYYDLSLAKIRTNYASSLSMSYLTSGASSYILKRVKTHILPDVDTRHQGYGSLAISNSYNGVIKVSSTSGTPLTYTLTGVTGDEGLTFIIQKTDNNTNAIVVTPIASGDITLDTQWDTVKVEYDGHQWNLVWKKES